MAKLVICATIFTYDEDGALRASMPCSTEKEVVERASKYDRVRVELPDGSSFWLRVKQEERERICSKKLPLAYELTPELLRGMESENSNPSRSYSSGSNFLLRPSNSFYDGWRARKEKRRD